MGLSPVRESSKKRKAVDETEDPKRWRHFVWRDENGKEYPLSTQASRQFYCNFYEDYVRTVPDFQVIADRIAAGECIRICGYDAATVTADTVDEAYLGEFPFGHERCLWTMWTIRDVERYPWRRYRTFRLPNRSKAPPCTLQWDEEQQLYVLDV